MLFRSIFADVAAATPVSATAVGSRDAFNIWAANGAAKVAQANDSISAVRIVGDKIYIAFAGAADKGGVAIVNLTAAGAITSVNAPAHTWANTNVLNLTSDGTDVYAVLADEIVKVEVATNATTARVQEVVRGTVDLRPYYTAKKADGTAFAFGAAAGQIGSAVAAEFMGDDLYVGTTTGLYKFTKTTVTK